MPLLLPLLFAAASSGLPYGLSVGLDCSPQGPQHLCSEGGTPVRAIGAHQESVEAEGPIHWLRVSGLEWQAFYVAPLGETSLAGVQVPVLRYGHPNAPFAGWDVAGPSPRRAVGPRVGRARMTRGPALEGETQAEARMVGCPLVPMESFPVALLFDSQGALRMLRLQALPEQPLAELNLACVASAMEGLQVAPGTRVVELQLTLL